MSFAGGTSSSLEQPAREMSPLAGPAHRPGKRGDRPGPQEGRGPTKTYTSKIFGKHKTAARGVARGQIGIICRPGGRKSLVGTLEYTYTLEDQTIHLAFGTAFAAYHGCVTPQEYGNPGHMSFVWMPRLVAAHFDLLYDVEVCVGTIGCRCAASDGRTRRTKCKEMAV